MPTDRRTNKRIINVDIDQNDQYIDICVAEGHGMRKVHHDETLKGTGLVGDELGLSDEVVQTIENIKKRLPDYLSVERLDSYIFKVTFDSIPEYDPDISFSPEGACSSFVKNGKLHRNFDWYYDNTASFEVVCKDFQGMASITGLDDGSLNVQKMAQLPYHMVDGVNKNGIMVSTHVLYNDWEYAGAGSKNQDIMLLPYYILSNLHRITDIQTVLGNYVANIKIPEALANAEYLLQFVVTDGTTTYCIMPPQSNTGSYVIQNITSNPKLTNFRWVNRETVNRTDSDIQTRPTGIERFNDIVAGDLEELRFTKCYKTPTRLSEFIGIDHTTKDSTDAELTSIYNRAHAAYQIRTRDGLLWQTVHSVVFCKDGIEHLWCQENWNKDYSLDGRVEKTDSPLKIYGTDENGEQTLYDKEDFGKVDDVRVNGESVVVDKIADVIVPTKTSDIENDGDGESPFATEEYVDEYGGKIDVIKRNNVELPIVDKEVNIEVPENTSDLNNDGDGESPFATQDYVDEFGGKIDVIKVNGTEQEIVDKTVDITVPTKTSDIENDSGFIDKSVNNLENYTLSSDLGSLALKDTVDYETEVTNKPFIPTKTSDITNDSDFQTSLDVIQAIIGNIVNDTTSLEVNMSLSAAAGKSLQDQIDNLQGRGKYLSIWDCTTGLAMDEPPVNPYTVETGSYFIVGKVASAGGTNYRPNGGVYDKYVPSTTVETGEVKPNDTYFYDGTVWRLLDVPEKDVAFSSLAGSPRDNALLKEEFEGIESDISEKADEDDLQAHIDDKNNPHEVTKAQVGLGNVDNTSDLNKPISTATQSALDLKANSADLADVATSGSYNDLTDTPDIPTKVSELDNDSGFVTSDYHDATKQDELTAGDNITIAEDTETGNLVISASSTEYTAGTGIDITNGEISLDNFGRVANKLYGTSHLGDPAMIGAGDNIIIDRFTISAKDTTYLAGENITITNGGEIAPGYTRVDYVEASGVAYIDTGTKMTANSVLTFVGKGSHTYSGGSSGHMVGVCSSNYRNVLAFTTSGTNDCGWTIGSAGYSNHSDLEMETLVINLPESKAYFNGTLFNINPITPENYNTYLFASNAGDSVIYKMAYGRLQSFKQEDNGVKTCEFVACVRQSDNRPGVYETVSGRFLTCSGLTAGPAASKDVYYINAVGGGTTYTAGTGIDITNDEISAVKGEWEWKGEATSSITFGTNTEKTIDYSGTVLVGYGNQIGYNTTDEVTDSTIIGRGNEIYNGNDIVAVGHANVGGGDTVIAVGKNNTVSGTNVIVIGNDIDTEDSDATSSIMIGDSVKALANNTIAIGLADKTSSSPAITQATTQGSIAIGRAAQATNLHAIAIGRNVVSSNAISVAIGSYVTASGMSSLAIGAGASNTQISASGQSSIAIGIGAQATNTYALSLGRDSQATQEQSVALGYSATATGTDTIALGNDAQAKQPTCIAIGKSTKSGSTTGYQNDIAIGSSATAQGGYCIAIGSNAQTAGSVNYSVSIGYTTFVSGSNAIAIGSNTVASGQNGVAIGNNALSKASGAIQLGAGTNSTNDTLQFKDYQLVLSDGYINAFRLGSGSAIGNVLVYNGNYKCAWVDKDTLLPSQSGQSGKFLTTDGTRSSWAELNIPKPTYDEETKTISF